MVATLSETLVNIICYNHMMMRGFALFHFKSSTLFALLIIFLECTETLGNCRVTLKADSYKQTIKSTDASLNGHRRNYRCAIFNALHPQDTIRLVFPIKGKKRIIQWCLESITIYDGPTSNSRVLKSFCAGQKIDVESSRNAVLMTISRSPSFYNFPEYKGFRLNYRNVDSWTKRKTKKTTPRSDDSQEKIIISCIVVAILVFVVAMIAAVICGRRLRNRTRGHNELLRLEKNIIRARNARFQQYLRSQHDSHGNINQPDVAVDEGSNLTVIDRSPVEATTGGIHVSASPNPHMDVNDAGGVFVHSAPGTGQGGAGTSEVFVPSAPPCEPPSYAEAVDGKYSPHPTSLKN